MLLGNPKAEHAEPAHLLQDLAWDLARLLPRIAMRRDLLGDEVHGLLIDRFELIGHVRVTHLPSPQGFRT